MNILDIPFTPKYSDEELRAAKDFLITEKETFGGTANFAIITENGLAHGHKHQQCHRGISLAEKAWGSRSIVATENGTLRKKGRKKELTEGFLRWFTQESCYSRFLLEKDLAFCRDHGFLISADVATPLLQNICIITRHFYEVSSWVFKKFDELISSGVPGDIAYPFCFNTGGSQVDNPNEAQIVTSKSGHRATPLFDLPAFKNFLRGDLGKATNLSFISPIEHYRSNTDYYGGTHLFFDEFPETAYSYDVGKRNILYSLVRSSQEFRHGLAEYRGEGTSLAYRPPNPFAPKVLGARNPEDLTYKELWEFALPWMVSNIFTTTEENKEPANG